MVATVGSESRTDQSDRKARRTNAEHGEHQRFGVRRNGRGSAVAYRQSGRHVKSGVPHGQQAQVDGQQRVAD